MTNIPDNGDMIGQCDKCGDSPVKLEYYAPTKEYLDKPCVVLRKRAVEVAKKVIRTAEEQALWDELFVTMPDKPV